MTMTGKEMVKLLTANGFVIERIHGSHYIMTKGDKTVTVPVHGNADLKPGLMNAILKSAGLK